MTSIGGSVYEGSNITGSFGGTTVTGGVGPFTNQASATSAASTAATTAANENGGMSNNSFNGSTINGVTTNGGVSVVDYASKLTLSGSTITITGNASQQFVFNFSNGLSLTNTTIILSGRVTAIDIFFDITGGAEPYSGSTLQGTFLDMVAKGSTPSMTFAYDTHPWVYRDRRQPHND